MRLSGRIIANLVPKPKPTLTRMIDMALEINPKVLVIEMEIVLASGSTATLDAAPAQQCIDVQFRGPNSHKGVGVEEHTPTPRADGADHA
jgi:hypothetical protein